MRGSGAFIRFHRLDITKLLHIDPWYVLAWKLGYFLHYFSLSSSPCNTAVQAMTYPAVSPSKSIVALPSLLNQEAGVLPQSCRIISAIWSVSMNTLPTTSSQHKTLASLTRNPCIVTLHSWLPKEDRLIHVAFDLGAVPLGVAVLDCHRSIRTRPATKKTIGTMVQIHSNDLKIYLVQYTGNLTKSLVPWTWGWKKESRHHHSIPVPWGGLPQWWWILPCWWPFGGWT